MLYGVIPEGESYIAPNMLYLQTGETYSCLGFLDIKDSNKTEITIDPSHMGNLVDSIGDFAFSKNESLEKVTLSNQIKIIKQEAFLDCTSLKEIDLGDGVEKIGDFAFGYCAFEEITIPASCTEIGRFVFWYCTKLTTIYYEGTVEQWGEITFGTDRKSVV